MKAGFISFIVLTVFAFFSVRSDAALITVNTTTDVISNDGLCSLREAVIAANTNTASGVALNECVAGEDANTDVLFLANGVTYSLTLAGEDNASLTGDLDIVNNTAAVDIAFLPGPGPDSTISQDASPDDRVFHIASGTVQMSGLMITGGNTDSSGGGFFISQTSTVTLTDVVLFGNQAFVHGGGISNGGILTLNSSAVSGNIAGGSGGGIYNTLNSVALQNQTEISGNQAGGGGGGIYASATTITVDNGIITNNSATGSGGGLFLVNSGVTLQNSSYIANNSASRGGAMYLTLFASATMSDTFITANSAQLEGGAIYLDETTISGSTTAITENRAPEGGAIYATNDSDVTLTDGCISGNDNTSFYESGIGTFDASMNWWGASDGPSGAGSGSGDSVTANVIFSGFLLSPPDACTGLNIVRNSALEWDENANLKPDNFTLKKTTSKDKLDCSDPDDCIYKLTGNGTTKKVIQKILINGDPGDHFDFSFFDKTSGIPANGTLTVQIKFFLAGNPTGDVLTLTPNTGTHDWEPLSGPFDATAAYDRIDLIIKITKSKGTVWFDDLILTVDP